MDTEESEVVKERPAQIDVRYRPGTFGFTTPKNASDSTDREDEKSPYEKLLEDETEKENKRREAMGLGFVLGTPNDESDGTILFNYDEPPPASINDEDDYRNQSFAMDSDTTLNNALRRAIREHQDQEMNKRFMEGGSSGSSLESVGSVGDIDDIETETPQQVPSEDLLTSYQPRADELTHSYHFQEESASKRESLKQSVTKQETILSSSALQEKQKQNEKLQDQQPQKELSQQKQIEHHLNEQLQQLQLQTSTIASSVASDSSAETLQLSEQNMPPSEAEQIQHQEQEHDQKCQRNQQETVIQKDSTATKESENSINAVTSTKIKKQGFFKRFFGSKK